MTNERFIEKLTCEGIGYALTDYFSDKEIKALQDKELSAKCLVAKKALTELIAYIEKRYPDSIS